MTAPWSGGVFLIAEAGVNHNGSLERALEMVELAAACGADAVKFQTFRAEELVARHTPMAEYQQLNTGKVRSQLEMLKELELSPHAHHELGRRAAALGILFFSTAFDFTSIDFLSQCGQPLWKIPSGEITNYPYLAAIGALRRHTILSTGMATLDEVGAAIDVLLEHGHDREKLCVLHCTTE